MARWFFTFALIACGCGATGQVPARKDASHDQAEPCGPATCSGCCLGALCVAGETNEACGSGGLACVTCPAGEQCSGQACSQPRICDPTSCSGCCSGNVCEVGRDPSLCGKEGAACRSCAAGMSCPEGECVTLAVCNAGTCPDGCCEGTTCRGGQTIESCGKEGKPCEVCSTGQVCSNQTCADPPPCSSICAGCCSGESCQPGTTTAACGKGGAPCKSCSSGQTCSGQACVTITSCSSTCSGCCSGESCQPGTTTTACGKDGNPCKTCSSGQTCSGGACTSSSACNATNCSDGCCNGSTCLHSPSGVGVLCGKGGAACVKCESYQLCNASGSCEVDPSSKWNIRIKSASLATGPTTPWDPVDAQNPGAEKPDPFLDVRIGLNALPHKTQTVQDTFNPVWNEVLYQGYTWSAIRSYTWSIVLFDADPDQNNAQSMSICDVFSASIPSPPGQRVIQGCDALLTLTVEYLVP